MVASTAIYRWQLRDADELDQATPSRLPAGSSPPAGSQALQRRLGHRPGPDERHVDASACPCAANTLPRHVHVHLDVRDRPAAPRATGSRIRLIGGDGEFAGSVPRAAVVLEDLRPTTTRTPRTRSSSSPTASRPTGHAFTRARTDGVCDNDSSSYLSRGYLAPPGNPVGVGRQECRLSRSLALSKRGKAKAGAALSLIQFSLSADNSN